LLGFGEVSSARLFFAPGPHHLVISWSQDRSKMADFVAAPGANADLVFDAPAVMAVAPVLPRHPRQSRSVRGSSSRGQALRWLPPGQPSGVASTRRATQAKTPCDAIALVWGSPAQPTSRARTRSFERMFSLGSPRAWPSAAASLAFSSRSGGPRRSPAWAFSRVGALSAWRALCRRDFARKILRKSGSHALMMGRTVPRRKA
jgi:hypothetical protein